MFQESSYHVHQDHVGELQSCTDWGKYEAVVRYKVPAEDPKQHVEVLLAPLVEKPEMIKTSNGYDNHVLWLALAQLFNKIDVKFTPIITVIEAWYDVR